MQAERDHLRTHVFPALEERLRSRRRHLEWVDLRLGVAAASYQDAEMRELHVLKVCLGEVQRCRPFLIVLLGDRYGWVPPPERIAAAAREVGFDRPIAGRSVTDLEIQFGILCDKERPPRCFFYFRQPLPYADMPRKVAALYADAYDRDPEAASRSKRLIALKGEIEARLPKRIRQYAATWDSERQCVTGLDAWGQTVLEDLWSEILATTASPEAGADISWQQAERNALDDYIEDRTRDFIGRGAVLSRVEDLASSVTREAATWGLCLTAPPGSGKSAIFGAMHRRLKQQGVFVLAHAAAASARATSVDDMIRRWIEELGAVLRIDHALADNADLDTMDATFHALLSRMASEQRVVVLVDALDQFEATTRGRFASWLPPHWPANVRLIATAVPCEASTALEARAGVEALTLPPLDADEARRIAETICARYHRTLEPEVLEALLDKRGVDGPAWGNTLWLVLVVEELNLVDGDAFGRAMRTYGGSIAEQLRALMLDIVANMPSDVLGLYTASFERAEKLFGASLAQAFLGFIAISRAGWRESDFRGLLPRATGEDWDELHFASLRRLFRRQIGQRGAMGQWDVSHAQMRAAVRRHLARRSVSEIELHALAAQYLLGSLPADDPLRQSEAMVHLIGSRDWRLAAEFYGSESLTKPERDGATRVLADTILDPRQAGEMTGLDHALNILRAAGHISDDRAAVIAGNLAERLLFHLEPILAERGELGSRAILLDANRNALARLIAFNPYNADCQRDLAVSHVKIGNVLVAQGNLSGAVAAYRASRDILDRLAKADAGNSGWQRDLSISLGRTGNVLVAQGNLSEALATYQASHEIADRLANAAPGNAELQHGLSVSHSKIGDVLVARGNLPGALAAYRAAHDILDRLAEADPGNAGWQRDLSVSHNKVGGVLIAQGNLPEALTGYRASHDIADSLTKADPGNSGWQRDLLASQEKIGDVLSARGDLPGALVAYRAVHDIADRLAKTDPGNAGWQRDLSVSHNKIGSVLFGQGNLPEALAAYRAAHDIRERLAKADPSNAEWQHDLADAQGRFGEMLVAQANLPEALTAYQATRDILDRLTKTDPGNAAWQRDHAVSHEGIGNVLSGQGNLAEALAAYRAAHDIFDHLGKADPGNAGWQRDLAVSREKIGDTLEAQGNFLEALATYRAAREIRHRLAKADPGNVRWQSDLAISHNKTGYVLFVEANLPEALAAYRASRDIWDRLAKVDPGNTGWQSALLVSHNRICSVLVAEGNLPEALVACRAAHDIADRLAKADPGNARWQSDLAMSHGRVGRVLARQGEVKRAQAAFHEGRAIIEKLKALSPDNTSLSKDLAWFDEQLMPDAGKFDP